MEGEAISATIGVLVQNLINLSREEISLIKDLQEDAEKLRDTFDMVQSFLEDAQTKSITNRAVKTWLKRLEAKAFDADNALDELNYQLLFKKTQKNVTCLPSIRLCIHRRDVALRINKINTSFEFINKSAKKLGLQETLAAAPAAALDATPETDSVTVDPIFIGRDDEVSKIVEMLTTPTEEAVSILPIVGMGGLGKTTLTRNVFNHHKIKTHFGQQIWVHVSQNFDALVLFKKILTALGGNVDESREDVLKNLREALKAKTYVLVLDDVWNEDLQKWDDFIKSWLGITSTKGNNIIVTTRNEGVGSLVKTLDMHLLSSLSVEECWSIIKDKAFERGFLPNYQDIGISIAKRCQGLPLAANVVGGVLRGKSYDEWLSIEKNWLSGVEGGENYVNKILKLSFHHLPSPSLKKCFAYCSIYPKGAQINKEELIQLWMAEGFLQPSQTSDMETVGNQILNVLLRNTLLQVVDREYGEVKHCSMHDLVHDVACTISDVTHYKRDELYRSPTQDRNWYKWGCIFAESSHFPKEEAKWLRTFIYNGRIVDIVFSNFKSLHALTLMVDYDSEELPDSIRELIHLRYLDISDTVIRYLPNSIGKLSHLQTIRLPGPDLKKLPSTLKYLINLRHLYLDNNETELPPQMGMLTSLQTIPYFKVRNKNGHRIVELGNLKNLKGELKIYNLEEVEGEEESKRAYLDQKSGIVRLVLRWGNDRGEIINDESVLKGLQPHLNIKSLEIDGFQGACFPSWTLKMEGLSNLVEIRIESCEKCEEIPAMGHLPHLKSLYLQSLKRVKCIGASFYGIEKHSSNIEVLKETITVFPTLERLELFDIQELKEWEEVNFFSNGAQVKAFPCLEYLSITSCKNLRSAPSQFTSLKELEIEDIKSELPLTSICGIKLKTLTRLLIGGIEGLTSLPDWLFHNNQHLSMLEIYYCDKLRELQDGMHNLNSLENQSILNCKNLESIHISGGKLQGLEIRDCPKLRELSGGMHNLNSLEKLEIVCCENVESIAYSVNDGGKLQGLMTSLRRLTLRECGLLTIYLGEIKELWAPLLEKLTIDAENSDALDCASFKKAVNGILQFGPQSLHALYLRGKGDWESLPGQLQHLTSLVELTLTGIGIEELPEWFGKLSNLRKLDLGICGKLKHLPSVEAMRRLTNLKALSIFECPLLKVRCKKPKNDEDGDSEWPKISHIPDIYMW